VAVRLTPEVTFKTKLRATCVALEFVSVSVKSASVVKLAVPRPTIASSKAVPRFVLVVVPQVFCCSPVPISSIFEGAVSGCHILISLNSYTIYKIRCLAPDSIVKVTEASIVKRPTDIPFSVEKSPPSATVLFL
jgi:hypothetical protein